MKQIFQHSIICFAVFTVLFAWQSSAAQPGKNYSDKKEQIEALRIGFITQQLNLTTEEAQKFWPVYNEFLDAQNALRKERHQELKSYRDRLDELSEKELTEFADKQVIYRQRELDLVKKYHAEFKSVLPIKKVALLYSAEQEFKAKLLKEARDRD